MVNTLQKEYDKNGKNAIFLEHDIDNRAGLRNQLWWMASGKTGSVTIPLVTVDSGYKYASAGGDFRKMYTEIVDAALKNPPGADLSAYFVRRRDSFFIHVDVTNRLRTALGYDNDAHFDVILYEDTNVIHVDRFVRQIYRHEIVDDIPRDGTASFDIQMDVDAATRTNYSKAHLLVILDYKPDGSRAFNSAQAVKAAEGLPPTVPPTEEPTATPEPTEEPTATEVPTEEPTVEPSQVPTDVPTAVPTVVPARGPVYLPYLLRE